MTSIVNISLLENCLDSSVVKSIQLDTPMDESFMHTIAQQGRLQFYADFPKPYFRIERPFHYVLQGVLGNDSLRVTFSPSASDTTEAELCDCITSHLIDPSQDAN